MTKLCWNCGNNFEGEPFSRYCSNICYYLDRINKNGPNGCWVWKGKLGTNQYPKMVPGRGNDIKVHHFSYEHHIGPIPEGMCVLHRCDNPPCSNPDHLFLGTNQENVTDKILKGRARYRGLKGADNPSFGKPSILRGEGHPLNKLTPDQVLEIFKSNEANINISAKFGISDSLVTMIKNRTTWEWLTKDLPDAPKRDLYANRRGENQRSVILTEQQVLEIYNSPKRGFELVKDFGVAKNTISAIKHGRSWGWLTKHKT